VIELNGEQAGKVHLLQYASYAWDMVDGTTFAHVNVVYEDASVDTLDLVIGANTAEWAFDRAEVKAVLQHTPISAAYSFWTDIHSVEYYYGHVFYAGIDTQAKPIDRIELLLDNQAISSGQDTWGKIDVAAITLQRVPDGGSTLALGGLAAAGLAILSARLKRQGQQRSRSGNGPWFSRRRGDRASPLRRLCYSEQGLTTSPNCVA
jgi:hypothetical protein